MMDKERVNFNQSNYNRRANEEMIPTISKITKPKTFLQIFQASAIAKRLNRYSNFHCSSIHHLAHNSLTLKKKAEWLLKAGTDARQVKEEKNIDTRTCRYSNGENAFVRSKRRERNVRKLGNTGERGYSREFRSIMYIIS